MPASNHKQKVLPRIFNLAGRALSVAEPEPRPVFEQLIYAVLREGATREKADKAYRRLHTHFFDWNEIRVSAVREVEEVIADLPHAETRALRIISLLQEVFEGAYSFDLESLHKKGLKQAEKQLERYQGSNVYIVAATMQLGLGGHALPLDDDMQRALKRLELYDGAPADEASQSSLEHLVPKSKGAIFCEIVSALAQQHCHEESPRCQGCPLNDVCPAGIENLKAKRPVAVGAGRSKR